MLTLRSYIKLLLLAPFILSLVHRLMASNYSAGTHSLAFITVPTQEVAKSLAHGLVKNKLAACVNIIPSVTSVYMWKGEVNEDSELLLKVKTETSRIDQLTEFVRKNHPYEICEVVTVPIQSGNPAYLSWITESLQEKEENEKKSDT